VRLDVFFVDKAVFPDMFYYFFGFNDGVFIREKLISRIMRSKSERAKRKNSEAAKTRYCLRLFNYAV